MRGWVSYHAVCFRRRPLECTTRYLIVWNNINLSTGCMRSPSGAFTQRWENCPSLGAVEREPTDTAVLWDLCFWFDQKRQTAIAHTHIYINIHIYIYSYTPRSPIPSSGRLPSEVYPSKFRACDGGGYFPCLSSSARVVFSPPSSPTPHLQSNLAPRGIASSAYPSLFLHPRWQSHRPGFPLFAAAVTRYRVLAGARIWPQRPIR
jgi:hypothetical protein